MIEARIPQQPTGEKAEGVKITERIRRGISLYAERHAEIEYRSGAYFVPSESGQGSYRVVIAEDRASCNCPDRRGHALGVCKHIAAALIEDARRPVYRVERRRNERGVLVYVLIEKRAGLERDVAASTDVGLVYHEKWEREGCPAEVA